MHTFITMTLLYIILGIGEAIIWPVLGAYATEEGRSHYGQGTMMGMFSFMMSGGVLTGAILSGMSMDLLGIECSYYSCGVTVIIITLAAVRMISVAEKIKTDIN